MSKNKETDRMETPKIRKKLFLYWLNLVLLGIIVFAANYTSYFEYYRRDLTEDQRYDISTQTINLLEKSELVTKRETPVKIIFAFQRTTQNYTRMRALLEEYERYSNRKIEIECIDPLRQPNRAREIALNYGVEFNQNKAIIDARSDTSRSLKATPDELGHVRQVSGKDFIVYEETLEKNINDQGYNKSIRPVAFQMEEIVTANLISALEGTARKIYVSFDKSNFGADSASDETSPFFTLTKICNSLNLKLEPIMLNGLDRIPADAAGFMLIGNKYDLASPEIEVLSNYWNTPNAGIFLALDPHTTDHKNLYRFLRTQGLRPQDDRIMLKNRQKAFYEINALFSTSVPWTEEFWQQSTTLEGESFSMIADMDNQQTISRMIKINPLLVTTSEYYGETKYTQLNPQYDKEEDNPGPLVIAAAIERGNTSDLKLSKETARMVVLSNIEMLEPDTIKPEQKDFLRACMSWITDREELSGRSGNRDLTIKLNMDRKALSIMHFLVNIILPCLALLLALAIWNTRRH